MLCGAFCMTRDARARLRSMAHLSLAMVSTVAYAQGHYMSIRHAYGRTRGLAVTMRWGQTRAQAM